MFVAAITAVFVDTGRANPYQPQEEKAYSTENPFYWEVAPLQMVPGKTENLQLRLHVPLGTAVYRDQLEVKVLEPDGLLTGAPDYPPTMILNESQRASDPRPRYNNDVIVFVPVTVPADYLGLRRINLQLRHQGCRGRLCFAPTTVVTEVVVTIEQSKDEG